MNDKFQKIKDHYDTMSQSSTQKDVASSLLDDQRLTSPNHSQTTILPDDTNANETNLLQKQTSISADGNEMVEMTQTNQQCQTEYRENATSCNTANGAVHNNNRIDQIKRSDPQTESRPNSVASFINDGETNQNSEVKNGDDEINTRSSIRFSSRRLSRRCSSRASSRSHRGLAPVKKELSVEDVKDTEVRKGNMSTRKSNE